MNDLEDDEELISRLDNYQIELDGFEDEISSCLMHIKQLDLERFTEAENLVRLQNRRKRVEEKIKKCQEAYAIRVTE